MLAFFDVLSWGYGAYVDLRVTAPSGREIQKFEAESEGRVDFTATEDGEHNFCFLNAQTETEVSFWVNTESDSALSDVAKQGKLFILLKALTDFHLYLFLSFFRFCILLTITGTLSKIPAIHLLPCVHSAEHVNDMVYSVEKLNSLVSAARVDLDAFKAREHHHRRGKIFVLPLTKCSFFNFMPVCSIAIGFTLTQTLSLWPSFRKQSQIRTEGG